MVDGRDASPLAACERDIGRAVVEGMAFGEGLSRVVVGEPR